MVDVHGPSSCFEECQRFLNLYRKKKVRLSANAGMCAGEEGAGGHTGAGPVRLVECERSKTR